MKRYDLDEGYGAFGMEESPEGEYVLYSEVEALIVLLRRFQWLLPEKLKVALKNAGVE